MDAKYESNQKRIRINDVITKHDIIITLRRMGLQKGMIVYVQSSLEEMAYLNGGVQMIIEALQEVLGYEGTLICSAFSEEVCDPACKQQYLFERDVYEEMRESMPAFHKKKTLPKSALARQLMCNDGVYRSYHPTKSFLAWGKYAKLICDRHPLHFPLGKDSPLDKVVQMNGYVLLLGEMLQRCDMIQYASTLVERTPIRLVKSPVEKKERKEFITMLCHEEDRDDFSFIQQMMEERKVIKEQFIATARCRFFQAKEAVVLAQAYFHMKDTKDRL